MVNVTQVAERRNSFGVAGAYCEVHAGRDGDAPSVRAHDHRLQVSGFIAARGALCRAFGQDLSEWGREDA